MRATMRSKSVHGGELDDDLAGLVELDPDPRVEVIGEPIGQILDLRSD